jgi:PAS domain S-box-containing protein
LRWPLALLTAIAIVGLGAQLIARTYASTAEYSEAEAAYAESMHVLVQTERTLNSLYDAQRGLRGFLLTQDGSFLLPYRRGRETLPKELRQLEELTQAHPEQRQRVRVLKAASLAALTRFEATVNLAHAGRTAEAIAVVRAGEGKRHVDTARHHASEIARWQEEDLKGRRRAARLVAQEANASARSLALLGAALLAITLIVAWVTLRQRHRARIQSLRSLAAKEVRDRDLKLSEAETKFQATFDQAAVGIGHFAPDGTILQVNDTYCEITGYSREELLAGGFQQITHPDDLAADLRHVEDLLEGRCDRYSMEKRYVRKGGEAVWVNLSVSLVRTPSGDPSFFVAVVENISARKAAEQSLAEQEARLRTIVETVPLGLVMAELPSGKIVGGNAYVEKMLRHPVYYSEDIHSYDEWISYHADGSRVAGTEYPLARMMLKGEENPSIEVHYQRGDDTRCWVRILGRPVRNEAGEVVGGVVALLDIDEERRAKRELEEALHAKELLLYEVNHRVKNSLQLVTSILAIEASKIADPDARNSVLRARAKINIIAQLHRRLYADEGHATVDFRSFLEETVQGLLAASGRSGEVSFEVAWEGETIVPLRRASPLGLAVNELVINALKYAFVDRPGKLSINSVAREGALRLTVSDDGPGLPEGKSGGAKSLGLALVLQLVKQMGGTLETDSGAPGARFIIQLPPEPQQEPREAA